MEDMEDMEDIDGLTAARDLAISEVWGVEPWELALYCEVAQPGQPETEGHQYLVTVRDRVVEALRETDAEDLLLRSDDVAERLAGELDPRAGGPGFVTWEAWRIFSDLEVWRSPNADHLSEAMSGARDVADLAVLAIALTTRDLTRALVGYVSDAIHREND